MAKYERFEHNGERYMYCHETGMFYDRSFIELSLDEMYEVAYSYFKSMDHSTFSKDELRERALKAKGANNFIYAEVVCEYVMNNHSTDLYLIAQILPIYTSVLRHNNRPRQAIDVYLSHRSQVYESSALLTSIAAAYLDIRDYANAKKFADKAYALLCSMGKNSVELHAVYGRLKSETEG